MSLRALALIAILLAAAPMATAAADGPDAIVTLRPGVAPVQEGGAEWLARANETPGQETAWSVNTTQEYVVVELRIEPGVFEVTRPRQIVPHLYIDAGEAICADPKTRGDCEYPLFEWVPRPAVWEVDGPARIANVTSDGATVVLRLGIPGPTNATLVLARDVTPPTFDIGAPDLITHYSFYVETTTGELALGDAQVRRRGTTEWIQNPTTVHHFLQKFPVQGLDADEEYEVRFLFTDWAENVATSAVQTIRTAVKPVLPTPVVTPLSPAPNATLEPGTVHVRVRIESPESPVASDGVRLFFDKREVTNGLEFANGEMSYFPTQVLDAGKHSVSVEVTNQAGGTGSARWSFEIMGANNAPLPALALLGALVIGAAARRR